jgi:hypothetical protein
MGWVLAGLMLLYPVDTFLAMRATREQFAAGRAAREAQAPSSGIQFDLRTPPLHCGPLGWAGAWAFMIGVVWVLVAGGLSLYYRLTKKAIARSSRRAFLVVAAGVATVVGTLILEWSQ